MRHPTTIIRRARESASATAGSARRRTGITLAALALGTLAASLGAGALPQHSARAATPPATTKGKASGCTVSAILVPSCGVWWGATAGAGDDRTASLQKFESMSTRTDIYHGYHRAGQQFPTPLEINLARGGAHKRLLMLDYLPEGGHSWAQVARGASDAAIDSEAGYLKSHFTERFFMSIHHEPEDEVRTAAGSGYTASDFRAMFRHVVQRFRSDGANNIVFVVDYMGSASNGLKSWFDQLYPGDDVVDWIAEDPYGCVSAKVCDSFGNSVNRRFSSNSPWPGFYRWAASKHPGKPLMLAEWGVFGNEGSAAKTKFISTVPDDLKAYPQLKALLYFNSVSPRGDTLIHAGSQETAMQKVGSSSIFDQSVS